MNRSRTNDTWEEAPGAQGYWRQSPGHAEPPQPSSPYPDREDPRLTSLRHTAMVDYALHMAGIFLSLGLLSAAALVINYVQRPNAAGTLYHSHFTWQIRTFWWWAVWMLVMAVPVGLTFGFLSPLFVLPYIWWVYRLIKGVIYLNGRQPMPVQ